MKCADLKDLILLKLIFYSQEPSTLTTSQRIHGINHWFPHRRLARARMRREGALTGRVCSKLCANMGKGLTSVGNVKC